jgi:hypothetical protein
LTYIFRHPSTRPSLVFELYAKGGGHWVDPPKVFGAKIGGGGCEGATGADSFVDIFGHYK